MVPSVSTLHPSASLPSALALKLNPEVMHHLRLLLKQNKTAKLVVKNGQFVCIAQGSKFFFSSFGFPHVSLYFRLMLLTQLADQGI